MSFMIETEQVCEAPKEFTGVIQNWKWSNMYRNSVEGFVYGDTKKRFSDGKYIYTSTVLRVVQVPTGEKYAITLNSTYQLKESQ